MENSDRISVFIRIRPPTKEGKEVWSVGPQSMALIDGQGKPFILDKVFNAQTNNQKIYEETTEHLVDGYTKGINCTVFAYGQTSSGKTYTMQGTQEQDGVIKQAVNKIFQVVHASEDTREYLVRVSCVELYNEEINDLLEVSNRNMEIRESKQRGVFIAGLTETIVRSPEEVNAILKQSYDRSFIASTNMNQTSSRSHTLFTMVLESRSLQQNVQGESSVWVSSLTMVDLAGSERVAKTGALGRRLTESKSINLSLFSLTRVIEALSTGVAHVPFRNSKLTRLLQPSLGGNSRTTIICTVSPEEMHMEETQNTLRFATAARTVINKAIVNEVLTDQALLKRQAKEIEQLREMLHGTGNSQMLEADIQYLRMQLLEMERERDFERERNHHLQVGRRDLTEVKVKRDTLQRQEMGTLMRQAKEKDQLIAKLKEQNKSLQEAYDSVVKENQRLRSAARVSDNGLASRRSFEPSTPTAQGHLRSRHSANISHHTLHEITDSFSVSGESDTPEASIASSRYTSRASSAVRSTSTSRHVRMRSSQDMPDVGGSSSMQAVLSREQVAMKKLERAESVNRQLKQQMLDISRTQSLSMTDQQAVERRLLQKNASIETAGQKLMQKCAELARIEKALGEVTKERDDLKTETTKLNSRLVAQQGRLNVVNQSFRSKVNEIEKLQTGVESAKQEAGASQGELNRLTAALSAAEKDVGRLKKQLEASQKEVEKLTGQKAVIQKSAASLKAGLEVAKDKLESAHQQNDSLASQYELQAQELKRVAQEFEEVQKDLQEQRIVASTSRAELHNVQQEYQTLREKLDLMQSQLSSKNRELDVVTMQLDTQRSELHQVHESARGLEMSVREHESARDQNSRQAAHYKELLTVSESALGELRVQLEEAQQTVHAQRRNISEIESQAQALQKGEQEKQTELANAKKQTATAVQKKQEEIAALSEKLKAEVESGKELNGKLKDSRKEVMAKNGQIAKLNQQLAAARLSVTNKEKEVEASKMVQKQLRITLDGKEQVVRTAQKQAAKHDELNLKMSELQAEIRRLRDQVSKVTEERDAAQKADKDSQATIDKLTQNATTAEQTQTKRQLEHQAQISTLKATIEQHQATITGLKADMDKVQSELRDAYKDTQTVSRDLSSAQEQVATLTQDLKESRAQVEAQASELSAKGEECRVVVKERDVKVESERVLKEQLGKAEAEVAERDGDVAELQAQVTDLTDQLQHSQGQHSAEQQKVQALETQLVDAQAESSSLIGKLDTVNNDCKALQSKVAAKDEQLAAAATALDTAQNDLISHKLTAQQTADLLTTQVDTYRTKLDTTTKQLTDLQAAHEALQGDLANAASQGEATQAKLDTAAQSLAERDGAIAKQALEVEALTAQLATAQTELEASKAEITERQASGSLLRSELEGSQQLLEEQRVKLEELQARLDAEVEGAEAARGVVLERDSELGETRKLHKGLVEHREALEGQVGELTKELGEAKTAWDSAVAELERAEGELQKMRDEHAAQGERLSEVEESARARERDRDSLTLKVAQVTGELGQKEVALDAYRTSQAHQAQLAQQLHAELCSVTEHFTASQAKNNALVEKLRAIHADAKVSRDASDERAALLTSVQAQLVSVQASEAELAARSEAAESGLVAARESEKAVKVNVQKLDKTVRALEQQVGELNGQLQNASGELTDLRGKYDSQKSQYESVIKEQTAQAERALKESTDRDSALGAATEQLATVRTQLTSVQTANSQLRHVIAAQQTEICGAGDDVSNVAAQVGALVSSFSDKLHALKARDGNNAKAIAAEFQEMEAQLAVVCKDKDEAEARVSALAADVENVEAQRAEKERKIQLMGEKLEGVQGQLTLAQGVLGSKESECVQLKGQVSSLMVQLQDKQKSVNEAELSVKGLKAAVRSAELGSSDKAGQVVKLEEELSSAKDQLSQMTSRSVTMTRLAEERNMELLQASRELESTQQQMQQVVTAVRGAVSTAKHQASQHSSTSEQARTLAAQLAHVESLKKEQLAHIASLQSQVDASQSASAAQQRTVDTLSSDLASAVSKLNSVTEELDKSQGEVAKYKESLTQTRSDMKGVQASLGEQLASAQGEVVAKSQALSKVTQEMVDINKELAGRREVVHVQQQALIAYKQEVTSFAQALTKNGDFMATLVRQTQERVRDSAECSSRVLRSSASLRNSIGSLQGRIEQLEGDVSASGSAVESKTRELSAMNSAVAEKEREIGHAQDRVLKVQSQLESVQQRAASLEAEVVGVVEARDAARAALAKAHKDGQATKKQVQDAQRVSRDLQTDLSAALGNVNSLQNSLAAEQAASNQLRTLVTMQASELSAYQADMAHTEQRVQSAWSTLTSAVGGAKQANKAVQQQRKAAQDKLAALTEQLEAAQGESAEHATTQRELRSTVDTLRSEVGALAGQVAGYQRDQDSTKSLLLEFAADLDGAMEAVSEGLTPLNGMTSKVTQLVELQQVVSGKLNTARSALAASSGHAAQLAKCNGKLGELVSGQAELLQSALGEVSDADSRMHSVRVAMSAIRHVAGESRASVGQVVGEVEVRGAKLMEAQATSTELVTQMGRDKEHEAALQLKVDTMSQRILAFEAELASAQGELAGKVRAHEAAVGDAVALKHELDAARMSITELREGMEKVRSERDALSSQVVEVEAKLCACEEERDEHLKGKALYEREKSQYLKDMEAMRSETRVVERQLTATNVSQGKELEGMRANVDEMFAKLARSVESENGLKKRVEVCDGKIKELSALQLQKDALIQEYQAEIKGTIGSLRQAEKQYTELCGALSKRVPAVSSRLANERATFAEQQRTLGASVARLEEQVAASQAQAQAAEKSSNALDARAQELDAHLKDAVSQLEALQLESQTKQQSLSTAQDSVSTLEAQLASVTSELDSTRFDLGAAQSAVASLRVLTSSQAAELEASTRAVQSADQTLSELNKAVKTRMSSAKQRVSELSWNMSQLTSAISFLSDTVPVEQVNSPSSSVSLSSSSPFSEIVSSSPTAEEPTAIATRVALLSRKVSSAQKRVQACIGHRDVLQVDLQAARDAGLDAARTIARQSAHILASDVKLAETSQALAALKAAVEQSLAEKVAQVEKRESAEKQVEELMAQLSGEQTRAGSMQSQLEDANTQLVKEQKARASVEGALQGAMVRVAAAVKTPRELESLKSKVGVSEQAVTGAISMVETLHSQLEMLLEAHAQVLDDKQDLQGDVFKLRAGVDEGQRELAHTKAQLAAKKQESERLQVEVISLLDSSKDKESQLSSAKLSLSTCNTDLMVAREKLSERSDEVARLGNEVSKRQREVSKLSRELGVANTDLEGARARLSELTAYTEEKEGELTAVNQGLSAELEGVKAELAASQAGVAEVSQQLMAQSDNFSREAGKLRDELVASRGRVKALGEQVGELEKAKKDALFSLRDLKAQLRQQQELAETRQHSVDVANEKLGVANGKLKELQKKLSSSGTEASNLRVLLQSKSKTTAEMELSISGKAQQLRDAAEREGKLSDSILSLRWQVNEQRDQLRQAGEVQWQMEQELAHVMGVLRNYSTHAGVFAVMMTQLRQILLGEYVKYEAEKQRCQAQQYEFSQSLVVQLTQERELEAQQLERMAQLHLHSMEIIDPERSAKAMERWKFVHEALQPRLAEIRSEKLNFAAAAQAAADKAHNPRRLQSMKSIARMENDRHFRNQRQVIRIVDATVQGTNVPTMLWQNATKSIGKSNLNRDINDKRKK